MRNRRRRALSNGTEGDHHRLALDLTTTAAAAAVVALTAAATFAATQPTVAAAAAVAAAVAYPSLPWSWPP